VNARLKSVAYRMLGSAADAEDVVQEAQLRLHQCEPKPDNPEAYLYRVVSNLCIDKLRRERVRRRDYFGPWLPEPWVADDAELTEMAEQFSMGFMLMLERLLLRVAERDVEGLVALMSEDVVAYADGGGVVSAAIAPVHGAARIAQVILHIAKKAQSEGEVSFDMVTMNGGLGLLVRQDGAVDSSFQIDVRDGLISRIYVVRNPHKLARLDG